MRRAAALALAAGMALAGPPARATDGPLEDAGDALRSHEFSGTVSVVWVDPRGRHTSVVDVRAAGGVVHLDGVRDVMTTTAGGMVEAPSGWRALWADTVPVSPPPRMGGKYVAERGPGPVVAGRETVRVELEVDGVLRERLALDRATGLLLQREQLGPDGSLLRRTRFDRIDLGPHEPVRPSGPVDVQVPDDAALAGLPAPYRAPDRLAGEYRRLGAYWRDGALQVLYSDGLYRLSVFEQLGRLDRGHLPEHGEAVAVGHREGVRYWWPGGQVVTWQDGDTTYTVVGDGPPHEVLEAARSIPGPRSLSVGQRLRRACRDVVETLSGRG